MPVLVRVVGTTLHCIDWGQKVSSEDITEIVRAQAYLASHFIRTSAESKKR